MKNAPALKDAVWTREQTRTTGIGHGLAIPHGKSPGVDSLAIAIGKPATPMDFKAIDSKPVRLIVLSHKRPVKLIGPSHKSPVKLIGLSHKSLSPLTSWRT